MRFKLVRKHMKELRDIRYSGSKKNLFAKVIAFAQQKKVMAMGAFALTAAMLFPAQSAFADEAPEVVDLNEGVTPIEQPVVVEGNLTDELDTIDVTNNETTPVVDGDKTEENIPVVDGDKTEENIPVVDGDKTEENTPVVDGDKTEENTPVVDGDKTEEDTPVISDTTEEEIDNAKDDEEKKDGVLEVVGGESHKGETSVTIGNSNSYVTIVDKNGNALLISNESLSYGDFEKAFDNINNAHISDNKIGFDNTQIADVMPTVGEPVVYTLTDGTNIMVINKGDGTFEVTSDNGNVEFITATLTPPQYYDPDTTPVFKNPDVPDEPTPDEPTPDEPTPDEPTPDEPTPDEPTPDEPTPTPEPVPEGYAAIAQTGDDMGNALAALGLAALGSAALAGGAYRRSRRTR